MKINILYTRRLTRTGTSRGNGGQRRKRKRRKVPSWTGQKNIKSNNTFFANVDPGPHYFWQLGLDPYGIRVKSWIRIRIVVEIRELQRLKMESWRVSIPVDADSHHPFTLMRSRIQF